MSWDLLDSGVTRQSDATEGPAGARGEEIPIGSPDVPAGCGTAPAAQYVLAHHEFAVVLTDRTRRGTEPGIGRVGAGGPFPGVPEERVGRDRWLRVRRTVGQEVLGKEVVAAPV